MRSHSAFRTVLFFMAILAFAGLTTLAQAPNGGGYQPNWHPPTVGADGNVVPAAATMPAPAGPPGAPATAGAAVNPFLAQTPLLARRPLHVTAGNGQLPSDQGQVWREYDISPYTARVTTTKRPEQAIIDWILRETGYEVWHSEPFGILSATPRTLRVYHTPQMQAVVADIVDRFVGQRGRDADLRPPHRHGRQPQLAGRRPSRVAADPRADAGRQRRG